MAVATTTTHPKCHSFGHYVTPAPIALRIVMEHGPRLGKYSTYAETDLWPDDIEGGWRQQLLHGMAHTLGVSYEAVTRRLYGIQSKEQRHVSTRWVDAALLACGLHMPTDCPIPSLPGSLKLCQESAAAYAEFHPDEVAPSQVDQLADELNAWSIAAMDYEWPDQPVDGPMLVPDEFVLGLNNLEFLAQIKEMTCWPQ